MPYISTELLRRISDQVSEDLRSELHSLSSSNGRQSILIEIPTRFGPHYAAALSLAANAGLIRHEGAATIAALRNSSEDVRSALPLFCSALLHRRDAKGIFQMMHEGPVEVSRDKRPDGFIRIANQFRSMTVMVEADHDIEDVIASLREYAVQASLHDQSGQL